MTKYRSLGEITALEEAALANDLIQAAVRWGVARGVALSAPRSNREHNLYSEIFRAVTNAKRGTIMRTNATHRHPQRKQEDTTNDEHR